MPAGIAAAWTRDQISVGNCSFAPPRLSARLLVHSITTDTIHIQPNPTHPHPRLCGGAHLGNQRASL